MITNKRDQILIATRDLIFEQGLQSISMAQIAQRAEVGMGTIYNYFASKEELVFHLYDAIKAAMSAYVLEGYDESQPVMARFLHLLTSVAVYGMQHPREFRLIEQLASVPFVQEMADPNAYALTAMMNQLFTEAQSQHLLKDLPPAVITLLISGALNALVEAHATQQVKLTDTLIEQTVAACWDAIKR
ncbi:MAG: TetR/AcrR family transcriptional regulator [Anaerolineae bacterium]|nr:TetR/AcrR family transcriptional regulator [Anaerolineae bacterium]